MLVNKKSVNDLILVAALILFAGLRPIGFDSDSLGYANWIYNGIYSNLAEPMFGLITSFWILFFEEVVVVRLVILSFAAINIIILYFSINKYPINKSFVLFLYLMVCYPMLTLTQIRFGVGAVIFVWAINDIINRRIVIYFLKIILATSFHSLMIIFLIFYFINVKKTNNFILISIIPISFIVGINHELILQLLENYIFQFFPLYINSKISSYLQHGQTTSTIYNFHFLFVLFIYCLSILNINKLRDNNYHRVFTKIIGIGILIYFATSFMPTMAIRVLYVLAIVALIQSTYVIKIFKEFQLCAVILISFTILLFLNTTVRNGLLHWEVFN